MWLVHTAGLVVVHTHFKAISLTLDTTRPVGVLFYGNTYTFREFLALAYSTNNKQFAIPAEGWRFSKRSSLHVLSLRDKKRGASGTK